MELAVLGSLEKILKSIEKVTTRLIKGLDKIQEGDRAKDLLRIALRVVERIQQIPGTETVPSFTEYHRNIMANEKLKIFIEAQ